MKSKLLIISFLALILLFGCYEYDDGLYIESLPESYGEKYKDYEENPYIKVADQPISTFSVDADGGSYANMRRYVTV